MNYIITRLSERSTRLALFAGWLLATDTAFFGGQFGSYIVAGVGTALMALPDAQGD